MLSSSTLEPTIQASCCFSFSFHVFGTVKFISFISAVRAGAGGDEAGIWAGDLVGR